MVLADKRYQMPAAPERGVRTRYLRVVQVNRMPYPRRSATWLATAVAVVLALGAVGGCTVQTTPSEARTLVVGASSDPALTMAAHIYRAALAAAGSAVSRDIVIADDSRQLTAMGQTERDLFPAFTGELLASLVPPGFEEDAAKVTSATASDFDSTYVALNKALPQGVSLADPTSVTKSGLTGAASDTDTLDKPAGPSQQLVPVYRSAALSREQVKTINKVAGELTADDLLALTHESEKTDPATVAARWVVTHGLTH